MEINNDTINHDNMCTICLTEFTENSEKITLECNHIFHKNCVLNWFRSPHSSGNCPLCQHNPHSKKDSSIYYVHNQLIDERFKTIEKRFFKLNNATTNSEKDNENYHKYIELELNHKNLVNKEKEIQNSFKEQLVKRNKVRKERYKLENKIRNAKTKIVSKYPMILD